MRPARPARPRWLAASCRRATGRSKNRRSARHKTVPLVDPVVRRLRCKNCATRERPHLPTCSHGPGGVDISGQGTNRPDPPVDARPDPATGVSVSFRCALIFFFDRPFARRHEARGHRGRAGRWSHVPGIVHAATGPEALGVRKTRSASPRAPNAFFSSGCPHCYWARDRGAPGRAVLDCGCARARLRDHVTNGWCTSRGVARGAPPPSPIPKRETLPGVCGGTPQGR